MNIKAQLAKTYSNFYSKIQSKRIQRYFRQEKLDTKLNKFSIIDYQLIREQDNAIYCRIRDAIYARCKNNLILKQKIKVAFMVYSASMWSCDELYYYFEKDSRFEPYVVVGRYFSDTDLKEFPFYKKTLRYFEESGYRVKTVELRDSKKKIWNKLDNPEIIFYLTPYNIFLPKELNIGYAPATSLCAYIPYCYTLCDSGELSKTPGMSYSWKLFCESGIYQTILKDVGVTNTEYFGYPRMDKFYESNQVSVFEWKSVSDNSKRIIYAPHHSFSTNSSRFSTFRDNYMQIYNYAASHTETTSWCIKLHPNLKRSAVDEHIFDSREDCEAFFAKWNSLPNAKVVEESTYEDIFLSSDAMICDSVSFLAEYQHTGKPLLYLENKGHQTFNEFGQSIYRVLYVAEGNDIEKIFAFFDEVVLKGNDPMFHERSQLFDRILDYRKNNNKSASLQIYEYIKDLI